MKRILKMITVAAYLAALTSFVNYKPFRLFVLGDSISLQYGTDLSRFLGDGYTIERKTGDSVAFKNLDIPVGSNGGDSRMVLKYLKSKVNDPSFNPDLFVLNCGLHDVKKDPTTGKVAVEEADYRSNLEQIYKLISQKKIPMMWVRTTGIIDSIHRRNKGFNRFNKDIKLYNQIADEVFIAHQVPEIDLFTFTEAQGDNRFVDHAHYTPEVRKLQAAYIAGSIRLWKQTLNFKTK
ncbi:SGNH/GDSL hydrolase family protein [Mucilaginibacter sp. PAMB04168]|uniref:SGNH/GDSL hydrolase family protein n=1 Tax=Mucilaginibacter sp. PAMB04168 TaxID=3138567 RepID=UPI0031F70C8B